MKQSRAWLTKILCLTCSLLFIWDAIEEMGHPNTAGDLAFLRPPSNLHQALFFDYPEKQEQLYSLLQKYDIHAIADIESAPKTFHQEWAALNEKTRWFGVVDAWKEKNRGVFMERIRQGQLWRLITPSLLHGSIAHLILNLSALLALGAQIEYRMGRRRMLVFMLLLGIATNIVQYICSGPFFLGFSGILAGLLAYIWMRQKYYEEELYPFSQKSLTKSFYFIIGSAALSIIPLPAITFFAHMAHPSHLSGLFLGIVIGKSMLFAPRGVLHERT